MIYFVDNGVPPSTDIMEHNHRTAKLWLQYQRVIQIRRSFLRAIRTGNWKLYLKSLCDRHPYLAAAGHNKYTKSLALFIPWMQDLERTHSEVYRAFMSGLFPVRRTDGAWWCMFTDLLIEQVLMAGLKPSGRLTRGRGFNERTRLLFLLSRPICSEISQSALKIAGLSPDDENGHRDLTASWINIVSLAAVFRDVTQRSPERNGCSHSNHIPFPIWANHSCSYIFWNCLARNFLKITRPIIALLLSFHNLLRYKNHDGSTRWSFSLSVVKFQNPWL